MQEQSDRCFQEGFKGDNMRVCCGVLRKEGDDYTCAKSLVPMGFAACGTGNYIWTSPVDLVQ